MDIGVRFINNVVYFEKYDEDEEESKGEAEI